MVSVSLNDYDWENIVLLLTEVRDSERFSIYLDGIIDRIDQALEARQREGL